MKYNFKRMSFENLKEMEKKYDNKVKDLVIMIENPTLAEDIEILESIRDEISRRKENG